ncbi:MAG: hypothetical protein EHM20_16745 [Alphaproteobacteria bacterium]|nr:MAG: hypothetical protein EHM20_16745 [Alphaproteobacteria bacterium]
MAIENKTAQQLGFWSAVSSAIVMLWWAIAFGLYQTILRAPWPGMQIYADAFKVEPFLAWIIPCFLLTFCFLTMMVCLHTLTSEENKIWSLLALVFAIAYTTILSACYYIQIVVVEYNLVHHSTDGLTLWLFASPYPHSIPGAMEGIGYAFMSLSFIFASKLFSGNELSKWIHRLFLLSGLTGLSVFTDPLFPLPHNIILVVAISASILIISSLILVSIWFKQSHQTSLQNIPLL